MLMNGPGEGRGVRLARFTLAAVLGLAVLCAGLFSVVLRGSRAALVQASESLRQAAGAAVAERVEAILAHADTAVADIENELRVGLVDPGRSQAMEAALFGELARHDQLAEVSFTSGRPHGVSPDGELILDEDGREQIAVERTRDGRLVTRFVWREDGAFRMAVRVRPPGGALDSAAVEPTRYAPLDPTEHPTFRTPARPALAGQPVWTDLFYSELDDGLPKDQQRKEVAVQKAVMGAGGTFVGVLRAGLVSDELERLGELRIGSEPDDPHRVFLCDRQGRLLVRLGPDDRYDEEDGDVRAVPAHPEPAIAAALAQAPLAEVKAGSPAVVRVAMAGGDALVTIGEIPGIRTQGWLVGVVAPESWYLRGLDAIRGRLLLYAGLLVVAVLVGGALTLRALRRGIGQVVGQSRQIGAFDFGASPARSGFAEVNAALGSLEVAKAALRALGRYVPIELVRLLFKDGKEPELGGAPREVSILFSDIEGFTTFSERLPPDELARALGQYLAVMTDVIRAEGGTIDKFIGDSVMVLWNAPLDVPDHAARACRTALAARAALAALYASSAWEGRAPWVTRFGLHTGTVLVGHFGAPDRMAYTALGDGVNLASRIEGQNKAYGTTILASEAARAAAGEGFVFVRRDRVAVKGKSEAVELHELIGLAGG
jgi:adenylate cyclase